MQNEMYVATVKIRAGRKVFQPGEVVDASIVSDMEYLIQNGYVKPVCRPGAPGGTKEAVKNAVVPPPAREEDAAEVLSDAGEADGEENADIPDEEEDTVPKVPELLDEKQLKKMKSKAAIIEYAESIGMSELDANLMKVELIDKVLEYIAGVMENDI